MQHKVSFSYFIVEKKVNLKYHLDAWIISTRDKMHCGHFAQMHGKNLLKLKSFFNYPNR